MGLNKYSNEELIRELEHREQNPTWFFRELVQEGYDLDGPEFEQATNWMDEPRNPMLIEDY